MVGYFNNNRYENAYGLPIKCFKCGANKCIDSKSFSIPFGGNGEILYCEDHEEDAKTEAKNRSEKTTMLNIKISNT